MLCGDSQTRPLREARPLSKGGYSEDDHVRGTNRPKSCTEPIRQFPKATHRRLLTLQKTG